MKYKEIFDKYINTDNFYDLPDCAQQLFFFLLFNANERGVVANSKAIARAIKLDDEMADFALEQLDDNDFTVSPGDGLVLIKAIAKTVENVRQVENAKQREG